MIALVMAGFFAFVLLAVTAGALVFQRWQGEPASNQLSSPSTAVASSNAVGAGPHWLEALLETLGGSLAHRKDDRLRSQLFRAGYRAPSALSTFHGAQIVSAMVLAAILAWGTILAAGPESSILLPALCGLGFGFLAPKRYLDYRVKSRAMRLRSALPPSVDLIVLALEAGQSLDQAMQEAARSLRRIFPDLAAEFTFCALEMRAGTPRAESLRRMGERCGEEEIRKLVAVLVDGERFGVSLGPALRAHAHYLRVRTRQRAQEAARKLSVKLVLPVFFLIFPSVLLVTLAPAYLQLRQFLGKLVE